MEVYGFMHLIQYSAVNAYHIVIQVSFMSTLSPPINEVVERKDKFASCRAVRDDREGAEAMIQSSYFVK